MIKTKTYGELMTLIDMLSIYAIRHTLQSVATSSTQEYRIKIEI
jgi:hypothetical protein